MRDMPHITSTQVKANVGSNVLVIPHAQTRTYTHATQSQETVLTPTSPAYDHIRAQDIPMPFK